MHQLTADPFISRMIEELSEDHKEVLYVLSLRLWSATQLALAREQSDRNIRKLRKTIHRNLQRQMFDYLHSKRAVSYTHLRYNPKAAQPTHWLRFLFDLLHPEDIPTVQEFIGYCLIPIIRWPLLLGMRQ